ncbi:hypothetical protein HMPREF0891_0084 [Lactobacillus crispatus 214-1]|nr:hypothetical protein HMPREF0891_0084 [Lactobacillus crispatus 214-1]MCT7857489.1 hypothetical protein [Lactobacillus crispatus]
MYETGEIDYQPVGNKISGGKMTNFVLAAIKACNDFLQKEKLNL